MSATYEGRVPFVAHARVPTGKRWQGTFPYHLFSFTLGGGAEYQLPGGRQAIGPGELLHFAPQAWQDWRVSGDQGWEVWYLIAELPAGLCDLLPAPTLAPGIARLKLDAAAAERIERAFAEMQDWETRGSPVGERLILNLLEYVLLLVRDQQPVRTLDRRIQKARDFLHRGLEQSITLTDVARAACLSKARLCALFKTALGVTPMAYLEQLRMERAARWLLFTTMEVEAIALRLGYHERKYFDKRFKAHWGVTPRQYRLAGSGGTP